MSHVVMEAETFSDLPVYKLDTQGAAGAVPVKHEVLRTRRTNDANPSPRQEKTYVPVQAVRQRKQIHPSFVFS